VDGCGVLRDRGPYCVWPCGSQILGREHPFPTFKKVLAFVLR
jgi:hypothetical protein